MRAKAVKKTIQRREQGFTLVEVMIAVCILGIGLLAVANMQIGAIDGNALSSNTTAALNLAEDKMEELFGLEWTDTAMDADLRDNTGANDGIVIGQYADANLDSLAFTDHVETNLDQTGTVNGTAGGNFSRVWNVADDTPINDTKTICVIVTWGDANGEIGVAGGKSRNRKVCLCSTRGQNL